MSNTAAVYKDALGCPICIETLTNPKMLTCGHSFCLRPCLSKIVKQHDPMCPLCRTPISLPPSGEIEDLPTNFSVTGLLDVLKNSHDEEDASQAISSHTQQDGDYVCKTCLQQVCSCCQLSFHVDNNHECASVPEFTEKLQQDVSRMVKLINESWSEESQRYTTASSAMPSYLNMQEKIRTSCNEILEALSEKKLDLKNIRHLQKQVKKDHSKFKEVYGELKQEISNAKKQEDMKEQLKSYQVQLMNLQLPDVIYRKPAFRLKISSFENVKEKAEILSIFLIQQLETNSCDILAVEEKLRDVGNNIDEMKQNIKDVMQDYHTFLLQKAGVTGHKVEPNHLLQIREEIEMMNFGSDRHSEDILLKCNELVRQFEALKCSLRESCVIHVEKCLDRLMPFTQITKKEFVEILVEMENCKAYYEDIYDVIGNHFVNYDRSFMKNCVENYLLKQETYVFASEGRTQFMKKHLTSFENFVQITKTHCKGLNRELSKTSLRASSTHKNMKVIEMRIETSDYRYKLLDSLSSMEIRCHKITEEFRNFRPTVQALGEKCQRCHENKKEVLRLWNLILKYKSTSISFDVDVMKTFSKTMEEKMDNVVSLLSLSDSEVNDVTKRMTKMLQITGLRKQLHTAVPEISQSLSNVGQLESDKTVALELAFYVASHLKHFTLSDMLLFKDKIKSCHELVDDVLCNFELECKCAYHFASLRRNKLLESTYGWLPQCLLSCTKRGEWNILDLTQENKDQWKLVSNIVRTDNFDADLLECSFNRAILLHNKVTNVSIKIFIDCAKEVLKVLAFLVLGGTLIYLYWKSEKG